MLDIDFILTYLDGNDRNWQIERNKYVPGVQADVNPNRYRNWDNLQFFFRGVEKYAPWVRKIHLVTYGHFPNWLNLDHPKLNIVKHSDYIPIEWLPTFSSRCIDMNFHRIDELSEHFVYFNDDMFLIKPVTEEDFFHDGLPRDAAVLTPQAWSYNENVAMHVAPLVDTAVINNYFKKNEVMRSHPSKWFNINYGKEVLRTINMMPYTHFTGFRNYHLPYSYLKETYREVWKVFPKPLSIASSHRFREIVDVNHWLFNYWQFATNNFYPRKLKDGECFQLYNLSRAMDAREAILKKKYKMICLNDTLCEKSEFEEIKRTVNDALETILGEKSSFEC